MRYSIVLSALMASALATPYVNVEVTEGNEVADEMSRGRHNRDVRRHHGGRRYEAEGENQGFFSSLWNRNRRNKSRDRSRNRRDRRHRNYDPMNMIDDIFGTNYECVIDGRSNRDERRDTRECCRENGGELSEVRGHENQCIFRDVLRNPREDWRNCALEQRGAEFAECYYREQREIDDDLDLDRHRRHGRRGRRGSGRRDRNDRDRNDRDRDYDDDNDRDYDDQLVLQDNDNNNNNNNRRGRRERYECNIDLMDDQKRQEIMQQCCEEEADGRLDQNNQMCFLRDRQDTRDFEDCAVRNGAQNAQCQRD